MAELAMLAHIQRTVYPKEVTHQLYVMAQARESSPVIDRRSNHGATPPSRTSRNPHCDYYPFTTFDESYSLIMQIFTLERNYFSTIEVSK